MTSNNKFYKRHWFTALFFIGLIFIVYSNTFSATWQLDDLLNIVENTKLHMENFSLPAVIKTFFAAPGNPYKLYRPIPCFTFALNWHFGRFNVEGYHLVNIFIHVLTAFFLYLTMFNLLKIPLLSNRYRGKEYVIAIAASLLWALNPIQTQAVTYIVQRMAAMAAMFYVIGIYCYIMAQKEQSLPNRLLFYTGCVISFLFALGSKENAIIFPFSLLLIKTLFFRAEDSKTINQKPLYAALIMIIVIILSVIAYFSGKNPLSFFAAYSERSFTLIERFLTEPRIILFYISQLFYPVPTRLSIEHDIVVSTSLFHPWTTLPSIMLVIIMIGIGFFLIKKKPLISLAILFFFLNHLIESSILPLELIFEHRNYLPSLFLFLPIAVYLIELSKHFSTKNKKMTLLINFFLVFLIVGSALSSHIRNMAWTSETTLWTDAMEKAPGRARPLFMVAKHRYLLRGEFDKANELFQKAFHGKASTPNVSRGICLNGMASVAFKRHDYDKSVLLSYEALKCDPTSREAKYNIVLALLKNNNFDSAMKPLEKFYGHIPHHEIYLNFKGLILLGQNRPLEAIIFFDKILNATPDHWRSILNKGVALCRSGNAQDAQKYLLKAVAMNPGDINARLFLLENSIKNKDILQIEQDLKRLMIKFDVHHIKSGLEGEFRTGFTPTLAKEILEPVIYQKLPGINSPVNSETIPTEQKQ
jgi:hypothetical protein